MQMGENEANKNSLKVFCPEDSKVSAIFWSLCVESVKDWYKEACLASSFIVSIWSGKE